MDVPFAFAVADFGFLGCLAFLSTGATSGWCAGWLLGPGPIMLPRVHSGVSHAVAPVTTAGYGGGVKIGDIAVCGTCLKTRFARSEVAAKRCACGGRIVEMPKGEVEKRRSERR